LKEITTFSKGITNIAITDGNINNKPDFEYVKFVLCRQMEPNDVVQWLLILPGTFLTVKFPLFPH